MTYGVWWGLPTCSWAVSVGLSLCRIISFCCGHISGSLMHYLHIHVFVLLLMYLCVRSTGLLLGSVGGSLTYIALLWCVWGLPICPWAVSVDLSCIVSFIVFDVMCVRCADLLLGCVGGPLMHHLVCYGVWWGLPTCSWAVSVGLSLSLSLSHYLIFVVVTSVDLSCIIYTYMYLCYYWCTCVWGPPACSWAVSVDLSHILLCCGVCEVYRFARGLCRWISHASSHLLYLMWCVWGVPTCSWVASVGLSCIIWYVMVGDEVCRPAPGLCRWSLSLSHYLILLWCVWGLPICSWVMSVDLSRIYPILFLMCVGSTDLLLGYVGGPLMHRLNFYGVCEVYRPAPGLCRWVSHFSHFNIWIFCFVVIWLW